MSVKRGRQPDSEDTIHNDMSKQRVINDKKRKFKEQYGESYIVMIFKKNMFEIEKKEYEQLRGKMLQYQVI